ncbi:putative ribonuclease H-like domain-containing protein, partial [Tanacetum coccineum]
MPALEDDSIFDFLIDDEDDGAEADMNNLDTIIQVSPNPTTRIHKDHPLDQVIGDLQSATQIRKMSNNLEEHGFIEAMQEELLQFKLQEVWTLVDLPNGKRAIGSKWVFRNKKDERGIVIRNKARLAPVARIEAIRLFLAYASFKDFVVYQIDVKSAFLYGKIEEEVYVCQPPGFEYLDFLDRVYKVKKTLYGYVDDIIFGSTKMELCIAFEKLMHEKFQMSSVGELTFFLGLQVKQKKDGIFISQDKYVDEILKKFGFIEVKTASTPMKTQKPLLKDEDDKEVDVHMYRSMIGSLMYLTSSRPDIMFAVCACARYQVNPKVSHLHAVKRIFSLDRKSTTGGCQFLGCRLISWQCKKQTVVANSTTEAEYVAASSCCGQVLWIQNQLLDYGLLPGFMRRDIDSLFGRMVNFSRRLYGRETAHALVEKKGEAKDRFYGKLILDLGNEVRSSMEQGTAAMEKLVEKLENVEEKAKCKKLKKELEEARLSNTFLRMQNERVERDFYWTRIRAHEFYQEMIRRGFVFEERLNEAIDVPIEDEKSPLSVPRGSPPDVYVDAAIAVERARQANVRNDASRSGPVRGRDTAPAVRECTFAGFMKCNPAAFHRVEGVVKLRRWFKKTESVFVISECAEGKKVKFDVATLEGPALTWFNELALICLRMVELERVKVDAYIRGLSDNIKGEVTSSKPTDLNKAVRMAHKLMEQKSQAKNERIMEGKKRKWENLQGRDYASKDIQPKGPNVVT